MFFVILLYALFASLFPLSKIGLQCTEPFFFIGARMTVAGIVLLAYQIIRYRKLTIERQDVFLFMLLALVNIFMTNTAEIWSIDHSESSKMCLIYSLSPFLSALVAYLLLKEKLTKYQWLGLCIGFLGLIPITFKRTSLEVEAGQLWLLSHVELIGLCAVLCSVFGWIILKKIVQKPQYTPVVANGFSMTLGGIMMLLFSYYAKETWDPIPVSDMMPFIGVTLAMCLISNLICYNLYGYLLKRYSATLMSFAGLVTPIFAVLFGWIYLNEPVTWHLGAAISFFGVGLYLFHREESAKVSAQTASSV
jgi:drug/metabolite transporter (DMT)-like permease